MPWSSAGASKRAVRGCFASAGKNATKRKKCRKMAHEARDWRLYSTLRPTRKPRKKATRK